MNSSETRERAQYMHKDAAVDLGADSKLLILLRGRIAQLVRALASHAVLACDYDRNPPTKSRQINSSKPFRVVCHRLSGACLRKLDHNSCTKPPLKSFGRLVCQSSVPIEAPNIASKKNRCAETVHVSFREGDGNGKTTKMFNLPAQRVRRLCKA